MSPIPKPADVVDTATRRPIANRDTPLDTGSPFFGTRRSSTTDSDDQPSSDHGADGTGTIDLQILARLMDSVFQIPGTGIRIGLDGLLGLIPGFGDVATSMVSLYILNSASQRGASRLVMARMAFNTLLDFTVGSIPVIGDFFDVYWRSNQRNVELLRKHLSANPVEQQHLRQNQQWFFVGLAVVLITALIGSLVLALLIATWLGNILMGR
jgi:hypothetical protein